MGDAEYKRLHREKGLCVDCSEQAYPGRIRCVKCLELESVSSKKYYRKNRVELIQKGRESRKQRVANGECIRCGNDLDLDIDSGTKCQNCREGVFYECK